MKIALNGRVCGNDDAKLYRRWGYEVCCPEDVRKAAEGCQEGEELVLELNSGGGSVYAGFEMYTIIREHKGKTVARVQSIAGSAMSVLMAGCDEVVLSPVANVFIHRSSTIAYGNSGVMGQSKQMLDTIDESMLTAYMEKVGDKTSEEQMVEMMREETFLTAKRAVEVGLADRIEERGQPEPANPVLAVACAFDTLPAAEDLRRMEREAAMERAGEEEEGEQEAEEGNGTEDITPGEGGEYQENHVRSEGEMEFENEEQLAQAYPELTAQIRSEAAEEAARAERERLLGIDQVAMAGFEDIVAAAKADPSQNAGTVAMAIVAQQKKEGQSYLEKVKRDAAQANGVPAAAAPETDDEEDMDAETKAAVEAYYGKEGK